MAGKKITQLVEEILNPYLRDRELSLYKCEYIKEGRSWFLRVYIEYLDDRRISTDDCEEVSKFLSDRLDEIDPIEQDYYLEVSSPGMDRALIKDEDFVRFKDRLVDIKLYKGLNGKKEFCGYLVGKEDNIIKIRDEQSGELVEFNQEQVAKTSLAIVF